MPVVRLASETDVTGWRQAARALRSRDVAPEETLWTVDGSGADLFGEAAPAPAAGAPAFTVPKTFVDLADRVILHRSDERFSLLYRLLWRLSREPNLLHIHSDPDVQKARHFAKSVGLAAHKMKAFVRFRMVAGPDGLESYVAWFEPAHRVAEKVAPFFVRRFASMHFSILTPDACVHWDTKALVVLPGADAADAPTEDRLEDYWLTYYASIFNPARLKVGAMRKEMPKRYWRNLPEARLIPELIAQAEARTTSMVAQPHSEPSRRVVRAAQRASRDAPYDGQALSTLEEVRVGAQLCRRCDLYCDATQAVPGEGPLQARLMLVGEQPGDREDLAGRPFVGPAGQMLDQALAEAGAPRDQLFVTNAVKHFKHEPRGKLRLHKTPNTGEVTACRWWLDNERRIVRPRVIVALGATAALAVFAKPIAIGETRQRALPLADQVKGVVTYHPSYLLRLPDPDAQARAYAMFVQDLKFAWSLAG
ncbi:UdgX family uracil-DNA binding protein [Phenylobacterium sp.]|uniref:UdgX family uracil-DNA binding protein n=1 Tax=Phenylobacterium sp. TaxID=1871053 RepID=UPI00374D60A4